MRVSKEFWRKELQARKVKRVFLHRDKCNKVGIAWCKLIYGDDVIIELCW